MNKRTIVVGICIIAIAITTLSRTARLSPLISFTQLDFCAGLRADPFVYALNNSNGDLYHAVKAFILSSEYRARFGPTIRKD
ncbi:MAG TPA: hypothetical protein VHH35_01135 [Pyrinomonadaceae bacterium]|nr:hypothetical protein [Pyrinomonadaceae bacterium]